MPLHHPNPHTLKPWFSLCLVLSMPCPAPAHMTPQPLVNLSPQYALVNSTPQSPPHPGLYFTSVLTTMPWSSVHPNPYSTSVFSIPTVSPHLCPGSSVCPSPHYSSVQSRPQPLLYPGYQVVSAITMPQSSVCPGPQYVSALMTPQSSLHPELPYTLIFTKL